MKLFRKNVRSIRPGFGLHPKYYNNVKGKMVLNDLKRGDGLKESVIEGFSKK